VQCFIELCYVTTSHTSGFINNYEANIMHAIIVISDMVNQFSFTKHSYVFIHLYY